MKIEPMLCQSGSTKLLDDDTMLGELKADGTRIWLGKEDDDTYWIFNRKGVDYTKKLPELIEAAKLIPAGRFVLDGEAVWLDGRGRTRFKGSQVRCSTQDPEKQRIAQLKYPIVMLAFDALSVDKKNIERWPIEERKYLLEDLLKMTPPTIKPLEYTISGKRELFEEIVAMGEEGLILKRLGSRYERGKLSSAWRKVKKWYFERVLVVGYTEGSGRREKYFGSLVLARTDDRGYLRYCGKVGTGFNDIQLRKISRVLREHEVVEPLVEISDPHQPVKVGLEITVKFYESTSEGVFRFPSVLKDSSGISQIHYNTKIRGKPKPRDLRSLLKMLK